jgi:Small nuclear RNA activating complex (SNAPc), subunit 1
LKILTVFFLFRNEVFKHASVTVQFIEATLVALKNKFLAEESSIKRAGILFLISKIYFTDDLANMLKLRIVSTEWIVFKEFLDEIKDKKEFEPFKIMFYHLFTENFFKFTLKNKALALDYGTPDSDISEQGNSHQDAVFWSEIRREIEILEQSEVVDLMQLNELRREAIEPFQAMFPEESLLTEALDEFEMLKNAIKEPGEVAATSRITRKEMSQACKTFLKASGVGSIIAQVEVEEIDWDSDLEEFEATSSKVSKGRKRKERKNKARPAKKPETSSSDSDNEREFKKMNKTLGYTTQNVMKGIGAGKFSEKLKNCYGQLQPKVEKKEKN